EMPGFYADGEYDLAGFIVGIVEQSAVVDGKSIAPGDVLVGLRSAGLHTNGYSLARKGLFDVAGLGGGKALGGGGECGGEVLAPHRSYLNAVSPLLEHRYVRGLAHVTGGGITENLPRILPQGCLAEIDRGAWTVPLIFSLIKQHGRVSDDEMFRTFNMGIGLV